MNRNAGTAAALIAVLALTGCTVKTAPAADETPTATAAEDTPSPTPTPTGPAESDRGNLIKSVGDTFGFAVDGEQAMTFTVTAITPDAACTSEFAEQAEHGHYLRLDVQGETTASLPEDLFIASGAWKVIADDGTTFNGDPWSYAAASCLNDAERLPNIVGAGETVSGAVLLDVPTPHGIVILDAYPGASWEWSF